MNPSFDARPLSDSSARKFRSVAVVSGKGGTGKTMFLATLAHILDVDGIPVTVIDADTGTGGLTYYFGVNLVANTAVGLADILSGDAGRSGRSPAPADVLQEIRGFQAGRFLGVGDHRRLFRELHNEELPERLGAVLRDVQRVDESMLLVDCRGGIDPESLAVCEVVDDIVLVVEADTTSFQASQHVVDVLSVHQLGNKLRGFVINKVIDDPSVVVRTGTSVFRCANLSAIPFDLEATRAFLVGELPRYVSPFGVQVWVAAKRLFPDMVGFPPARPWTLRDFREIGFSSLDSVRGGLSLSAGIALIGLILLQNWLLGGRLLQASVYDGLIAGALGLGFLAGFEPIRRALGRMIVGYVRFLSRVVRRRG